MSLFSVILIAFGLSVDAFAVSVSNGISIKDIKLSLTLKIALFFGLFQAVMPLIGWLTGMQVRAYIGRYANCLAFLILLLIGIKMIYEALRKEKRESCFNCSSSYVLLLLALATSIDAFAVGFSFSLMELAIFRTIVIIGITTFIVSLAGIRIGQTIGHFFEKRVEILGGLILIFIALKIVFYN